MAMYRALESTLGEEYCGNILHGDYSEGLKNRLSEYINCFFHFEKTGNPAIPYISAWVEGERNYIWYEFVSRRFRDVLAYQGSDLADIFRKSIIEHRIYKYLDYQAGIKKETLDQQELHGNWGELREKRKQTGFVEAIYKIHSPQSKVLWLKDQATIELFELDRICLSLGCLTVVTLEMEAEEQLKRTETQLALSNLELNREVKVRKRAEANLQKLNQKLKRLATLDSLTKIPNRRCFDQCLNQEWKRLKREQKVLSLIMCDVDYFKFYNDTYGHKAGDACLHAIAQAIRANARRPGDLVARYGGEEFAVILPNTDSRQAIFVAESIQAHIRHLQIVHAKSPVYPYITISLGISSGFPHLDLLPDEFVETADRALYKAKQRGRNCLVSGTVEKTGQEQAHHKFA